jgi:DNA-directed RNA polymerase subunit alpha
MLVIQRPTVEAIDENDDTVRSSRSARSSPASATPSATRCAARCCRPSRRRDHAGALRRRLHEFDTIPVSPKTSPTSSQPQGHRAHLRVDEPYAAPRRARPGRRHRQRHQVPEPRSRSSTRSAHRHAQRKGRLAVDLTVERGRGYLSSRPRCPEPHDRRHPVDAIFSPVRRVMFTVEPTRVEQSTNYDRLVLDIETDGSITPREALASAGATLRSLVDLVASLSDEPQGLELGEVATIAATSPDLDLPSRTSTCPSAPATASSAPRSTRSASCSPRPRTTCSTSPTSVRRASTRSSPSSTSAAWILKLGTTRRGDNAPMARIELV